MPETVARKRAYLIAEAQPFAQSLLWDIQQAYQHSLTVTHLLFPATGLRCLDRLKALSGPGLLLLSADNGSHQLSDLEGRKPPTLVSHKGCFSLSVNYHALKAYCVQPDALYKMAECYRFLRQQDQAQLLLKQVVDRDPANVKAQSLLAEYESR